jgi:protein involved in polysaccharide export with SLBB domain
MRTLDLIQVALAVTCFSAWNEAHAQGSATDAPTLQPGDHVRITVLGEDKDLSGEFEVASDSSLKHPLYSQVKVVGVPLSSLNDRFASFLRRFQKDPQFEIEPFFKVGVTGEVKTPNIYFLAPETTIGEALTRANGATDRGDIDRVVVVRNGRPIAVDLGPLPSSGGQITVRSGDQINVALRRNIGSGMEKVRPFLGVAVSLLSVCVVILTHR